MKRRHIVVVALLTIAGTGGAAYAAPSPPPPPHDLTVEGGAETWHAVNSFRLDWRNPPSDPPVAAIRYRVRDQLGRVVFQETRIAWPMEKIHELHVPGPAGSYTAEVWLEDTTGTQGPPAMAKLKFDDARPPLASPRQPTGWIGRRGFPHTVRIDLQAGETPISGIRGYAASVDRSSHGVPCAGSSRCDDLETDLRGGIDDDTFAIGDLPAGLSYVHVVAVSGSRMRSASAGHATLRVDKTDPATQLDGAPAGWVNHPVVLRATAVDALSGMNGGGAFTAIRVGEGVPTVGVGAAVQATVIESGAHDVAYYARDVAGNINDGATINGQQNEPPAGAVVRIDRTPPSVAFRNSQDPGNPELIEARVIDRLSGPNPEQGWIGVRGAGTGDRFEELPTEIVAGRLQAEWDSDAQPAGDYEFQAIAWDVAGNTMTSARRLDGSPMVLSNPIKAPTLLSAGFGGSRLVWHSCVRRGGERRCRREAVSAFERRPERRVVPYGRGTLLSGRLTTGFGSPLEGTSIQIVENQGPRSDPVEKVSKLKTRGDGSFSVRLAPGPSREISARFEGNRTLGRSTTATIRLAVRSGVLLRASSPTAAVGGKPVLFSGKVLGQREEIPAEGNLVTLQFRLPGVPWTEFRTIQTDRRGRFRYAYRFSDDDSRGVRFQFRAHAPAQGDWPYEPGSSRPVVVHGI